MVFETLPEFVNNVYFGSTIAQYLVFSGIIIGSALIAKIVYFFIKRYGTIIASKTENQFDDLLIEAIENPLAFFGFIIGLNIGYQFLTPTADFITNNFGSGIEVLIILNLMWLALRLIDGFIEHIILPLSAKTESKLDDQLVPILRKVAKVVVVVIAFLIILSNFGVDVLPLIAGLGIGGLAIAFAAQKTVEDVFGGFSIFISKPFVIGDTIKVAGIEGTVETVGIRFTKIRDLDNRLNIIPNAKVAQAEILNITSEPMRRVSATLGLAHTTSRGKIQEAIRILKEIVKKHPDTDHDEIRAVFKEYGNSSLNIWFIYHIKNQDRKFDVMSEINLEIKKQFEKAKIEFAFPPQGSDQGKTEKKK